MPDRRSTVANEDKDLQDRKPSKSIREEIQSFPPVYFSMVMATGIVSIAAFLNGIRVFPMSLLWLNAVLYVVFWLCLIVRIASDSKRLFGELTDFKLGPGFFTIIAGTSVLARQLVIIDANVHIAEIMLLFAVPLWACFIYVVFTAFTVKENKPTLSEGIHGGWLLSVVATQAISVLATLVARSLLDHQQQLLFLALALWLCGGMLYIWIISLIFYRYTFFPFAPSDLMPPYWINMGAMAISTLAGVSLIQSASAATFLEEILPFLKGFTLFFWATATWWIPMLVILGFWRHVYKRFTLKYDRLYWGAVFPLGMYSVCTRQLCDAFHLPFLLWLPHAFAWIALIAWSLTFLGLLATGANEIFQARPSARNSASLGVSSR
ncbi:MAG TPA: tellurite resistance/C4-dicarboxylate transporter family protein [Terriglobales bacterium]|nr:tellurite resistance/C4-dicarboxylate transporter family protein [Terriglobales bacterium]